MNSSHLTPSASLQNAIGRLRGALFMIGFGAAWIAMWCLQTLHKPVVLASVALLAAGWMRACARQARQLLGQLGTHNATPQEQRVKRLFHMINVGQWVAVLLAILGLNVIGHVELITAAVILIVGLHFFPLASIYGYRAHHVTGAALVLVALAYPLLAAGGPKAPIGCLAAGIVLWCSALWACMQARAGATAGRFAHAH